MVDLQKISDSCADLLYLIVSNGAKHWGMVTHVIVRSNVRGEAMVVGIELILCTRETDNNRVYEEGKMKRTMEIGESVLLKGSEWSLATQPQIQLQKSRGATRFS